MKKKIFSVLGILILGLNTVFCNAVEISFSNLDSQNGNFYIDGEKYSQESLQDPQESFQNAEKASLEALQEEENILEEDREIFIFNDTNFQESSSEATENNYIDKKVSRINLLNSEDGNPVENLSIPDNLNYTTVDLTNLATGEIITHDCNLYLITNFDETEHWNECSICGKILNKESHTYVDNGWTGGGTSNCSNSNVHMFSCQCGYSYSNTDGRAEHTYKLKNNTAAFLLQNLCSVCLNDLTLHKCILSNGTEINCQNPGTCSLCGYTYSSVAHLAPDSHETGNAYCRYCNTLIGTVTKLTPVINSVGNVTLQSAISVNGAYSSISAWYYNPNTGITVSLSGSGTSRNLSVKFNSHYENKAYVAIGYDIYVNGKYTARMGTGANVSPENIPPVITNIITNNSDEWSTDTSINISGTENYCNSVNLTLKDKEGNIYAENIKTSVTGNNWTYEIKPSLEAPENTEFILTVSDSLDNTKEQSFYISKVDTIPPKTVESETLNTDWSKTKDYIFTSSDYGIGQVQNSVINTDNYEPATENENIFYKGYIFTGDVYGETFVPVYMKDGLGNSNVEFVSVSNLDNTPPTIENIELNKTLHNTEITISANDINDKLNASGSGVTGYAISTKNEIPDIFQEENTFNISESGKYYIFVTDAVGNITSRELNIPVQYKVTINPDGGTWKGDTNPQEYITDESINLYPEPEKEGYTFKEWDITGNGKLDEEGNLIINGDVIVTPIWEANKYEVTFIDYDVTHNRIMDTTTRELDFNSEISGSYIGNDVSDNAYYKQYKFISDTSVIVSTNPENNIVYRYFEFCYTEKESHLNFNDDNNKDGLRPEKYKLQLVLEDGELIQEVTLPTSQPDYTFENLPKYDEQGEEYIYKIVPIISDRYDILPNPEDESTPEISYNTPECKILIPKTTTLDGKDGNLTYTIQVEANLFYKDKIILIPEESVTLTDGVKNMVATIIQDKTEFNKEDELQVTGRIQVTKKHFAGVWHGTFNFKIRYEVKN